MNLANEGLEAKKKEDEVTSRKRKAEDEKTWEGQSPIRVALDLNSLSFTETRDQRVDSWRTFASTNKKKKKTKVQVLG